MAKTDWEITAGREVSWNDSHNWWVMTWIKNGSSKQKAWSPLHIFVMSTGMLMLPHPPYHAVQFGDSSKIAGDGDGGKHLFYIQPHNIWARMPLFIPETPNVEMFFEKSPFPLTDAA